MYQSNAMGAKGSPPILGPMRVMPGRLSVSLFSLPLIFLQVSRTFGDCMAKMDKYGGNPKVIISEPDIFTVPVDD